MSPPSPTDTDTEQVVLRSFLRSRDPSPHHRRAAKELAWRWVGRRWPRLVPDRAQQESASLHLALPGRRLRVESSPDGSSWLLEVSATERDGSCWTTTAQVGDVQDAGLLALETRCAGMSAPRIVAPPKLLGSWVQQLPLQDDGIPVSGEARAVEAPEEIDLLCTQLVQPARKLPFVLLANKPGTRYYGIDPRGIADSLQGLAHVVCLAPAAVTELTHRFGRRLAPAVGAVRIYLPGFDATHASYQHPTIRPRAAAEDVDADPAVNEATAFRRHVCRRVCELGASAGDRRA